MSSINEARLAALSATAFENLIFDLIRSEMMENVAWRTPGADGGRDIEGVMTIRDFAGQAEQTSWLIECKRYKNSVNWPTVWEKVAYADASQADFLLLTTTSKFSTRCLDEIAKWNSRARKPAIRVWPGHEVAFRLLLKPNIARKYRLLDNDAPTAIAIADLALHVAKMSQSALASSDNASLAARYRFAAAALADLMFVRSRDLQSGEGVRISHFTSNVDLVNIIPALSISDLGSFDAAGLRAFLACLAVVSGSDSFSATRDGQSIIISKIPDLDTAIDSNLLRVVALWSGLEPTMIGENLCLVQQILI